MKSAFLVAAVGLLCPAARAAFDETGFSARALGMGSAFTAIYDDPAASAHNPATASQLREVSLSANFLRQFHIPAGEVDQTQISGAVAVPVFQEIIKGVLVPAWSYVEQKRYAIDRTIAMGYATRGMTEFEGGSLDFGTNLKIFSRNFARGNGATKVSMDWGLLARFGQHWGAGVSLLSFNGPSFDTPQGRDRAPVTLKVGVSQVTRGLTLAADISKRESSGAHPGSTSLGVGFENWWPTPRRGSFAARTGLNVGDHDKTWRWGAGWKIFSAQFDYAMTVPLDGVAQVGHALSFTFRFGRADPELHYERILKEEQTYRRQLGEAIEAGEVRQWQLQEELKRLRSEILALKEDLAGSRAAESRARERIRALEEQQRRAQDAQRRLEEEARRLKGQTKDSLWRQDWAAYQKLKTAGAPDPTLQAEATRLLRHYKDTGVDLSEGTQELRRLQSGGRP